MNELQIVRDQENRLSAPLTANDIIGQVRLIQEVMQAVMRDKEHFGTIPGCGDKPTLLQPGAQKLLLTFRLAPEYEVIENPMGKGHREYRVHCTLKSIGSGNFCGSGVGCCSTMEGKYRFRVAPKKFTDRTVPKEYWDIRGKDAKAAQALLGGPGFSTKKDDNGQWMITEGSSEKVEHDNPADYYNTVLKMAKKRALVDATLTATAASDIFTADIEDMPEVFPHAHQPAPEPTPAHQQAQPPQRPAQEPKTTPAASTARPAPTQGDNQTREDVIFTSYKQINSKPGAAKAWAGYFCTFERTNGEKFEAGTFSKTIAESFDTLQGNIVTLIHQPGNKQGTREIVSVGPPEPRIDGEAPPF